MSATSKAKFTDKQSKYIKNFLANGGNKTQACIDAGYSKKTARTQGKENHTKPHILEAIEKAQSKDSEKLSITRESLLADIQYAKDKAKLSLDTDYPQYQHFLKASEMQAKMLGLNEPDKIDIQAELRVTCSRGAFAER